VTSFRVLGPVEAWTDERRLVLGGPQQVKLLAFLLLNANRAVSGDAVIDAVWGAERDGAAHRLQMAVSRLRKTLAPLDARVGSRLRTVSGGYLLSLARGELDTELFAQQIKDGRRALEHGDPAQASGLLTEALTLWRGPPLAEVAFEDFAQAEMRRLEELRLVALETRIDADLQQGRHRELIGELEAILAQEPSREGLAAQLMIALYRSGRQAEALAVYQRIRRQLVEQLGLEPGPELGALQSQILERSPALARDIPAGGTPLRPRSELAPEAVESSFVANIERAERSGKPFLLWRGGDGLRRLLTIDPDRSRLTIGRDDAADISIPSDAQMSRIHALLERLGSRWTLVDDGLSRHGSYVNGTRLVGRRWLADQDRLRFGATEIVYHEPSPSAGASTASSSISVLSVSLSPMQRRVVAALSAPVRKSESAIPASDGQISAELGVSTDVVAAHLRGLFELYGLSDLPPDERRARLAATVLLSEDLDAIRPA
jgi:DNA-binding SARP family transcriptional activator